MNRIFDIDVYDFDKFKNSYEINGGFISNVVDKLTVKADSQRSLCSYLSGNKRQYSYSWQPFPNGGCYGALDVVHQKDIGTYFSCTDYTLNPDFVGRVLPEISVYNCPSIITEDDWENHNFKCKMTYSPILKEALPNMTFIHDSENNKLEVILNNTVHNKILRVWDDIETGYTGVLMLNYNHMTYSDSMHVRGQTTRIHSREMKIRVNKELK